MILFYLSVMVLGVLFSWFYMIYAADLTAAVFGGYIVSLVVAPLVYGFILWIILSVLATTKIYGWAHKRWVVTVGVISATLPLLYYLYAMGAWK